MSDPAPTDPASTDLGPTVLIVGAGGQLGRALQATAPTGVRVRALGSAQLDLTDPDSVTAALADLGADQVVINAAAYTDVDGAESDRDRAYAVNATGPELLARATAATGARLIHVSTDYVFGPATAGQAPFEPADLPADRVPATVYGASKLAGERAVLAADPAAVIVRTAWVFTGGPESADFVGAMRRLEVQRDRLQVVDDQLGSPTYAVDLAAALWELALLPAADAPAGVLHATNAGQATWHQLARAVFAGIGADPERVRPCTTEEFPRPAPRPRYSVLSGASWAAAGLTPLRPWREALAAALTESGVG